MYNKYIIFIICIKNGVCIGYLLYKNFKIAFLYGSI
jgi:hypothetical protein